MKPMTKAELDRWYRDPGDLYVWEDIAAWFHKETGHLRPGKDKPIGFHTTEMGESDCCMDAWVFWRADKQDAAVAGLRARVAELSGCEIDMQHYREKWQKAEARVEELSRAYAVQGLVLEEEQTRVAELEALLRRVDTYFQHTGKVGDLPVSVHALLPKLVNRHEDGTETTVTPLPMWQP